jgi:molecular chaperone Hsp33
MDKIIHYITKEGQFQLTISDTTNITSVAQEIHNLTKTTTAVLGRVLTGASLMGSMAKNEESSLTLKIKGDGPVGNTIAVSDSKGNVRGYMNDSKVELPIRSDGKIDVGGAVGRNGILGVIKESSYMDPYIGQIPLISGEIAEDITNYFAQSEQIPTVCALGVLVNGKTNELICSGGYIIQALPGASEKDLETLEKVVTEIKPVTQMLSEDIGIEGIADKLLYPFGYEKMSENNIKYVCTCNTKRITKALITLGKEELYTLPKKDGAVEVICPFCEKKYLFYDKDIDKLVKSI